MLQDSYNLFLSEAKLIKGFVEGNKKQVPYDVDKLVLSYYEAKNNHDNIMSERYLCAIIVRLWHLTVALSNRISFLSKSNYDDDDVIEIFIDSILKGLEHYYKSDRSYNVEKFINMWVSSNISSLSRKYCTKKRFNHCGCCLNEDTNVFNYIGTCDLNTSFLLDFMLKVVERNKNPFGYLVLNSLLQNNFTNKHKVCSTIRDDIRDMTTSDVDSIYCDNTDRSKIINALKKSKTWDSRKMKREIQKVLNIFKNNKDFRSILWD